MLMGLVKQPTIQPAWLGTLVVLQSEIALQSANSREPVQQMQSHQALSSLVF
jgi:hypothetical protein